MNGRVITFYSYKGGTGRTMALANIACLLSKRSAASKVLMIDCDLEAPGLPAYFERYLPDDWKNHGGWIDLVQALDNDLSDSATKKHPQTTTAAAKTIAGFDLSPYITETEVSGLSFISAGRQKGDYSTRVNTFDWHSLFYRSPHLFSELATSLCKSYDFVLIDSRTGETDVAGICTSILPDTLVTVFTPNQQSVSGLSNTIKNAIAFRKESADLRPLIIVPLPSRIDSSDSVRRHHWRFGGKINGKQYEGYQLFIERILAMSYGYQNVDLTEHFEKIQIDYSAEYSFGEDIAVLTEASTDVFTQTARYEALQESLLNFKLPGKYTRFKSSGNRIYLTPIDQARQRVKQERLKQTGKLDLMDIGIYTLPDSIVDDLSTLQSLNITGTQITDLSPVSNLQSLQSLNIADTQITDLSPVSNLQSLQSLNIARTQITDLSPVSNLQSLQSLRISYSQITDLSPLSNLQSLQSLNIAGTQITDLSPVSNLQSLQSLNIAGTQITDLSPVSNLQSLQSLNIAGTQITDLSLVSNLQSLQSLNIARTQITDLSPVSNLQSLQSLNIAGTQITDLSLVSNLQSLQSLNIAGTQITDLSLVSNLQSLQSLNIMNTQITDLSPVSNLQSLQSLYIMNTQITDLSLVSNLQSLQSLYIMNTQITDLSPVSNLQSLQSLDISFSQITDLSPVSNLQSLQSLNIMSTQITDLSPVSNLQSLQSLNIADTQITDLSPVSNLQSLQSLDIADTQITDLSPVSNLQSLQSLNIAGTQITDLSPVSNLQSLQSLNIADTQITDLSPVSNLQSLQSLNIADTQITDLSPVSNLQSLQSLDIADTQITDLSPVSNLQSLQSLDIADTQITDLSPVSNLQSLQSLNIAHTQITDLSPVSNLQSLRSLDITNTQITDLLPVSNIKSINQICANRCELLTFPAELALRERLIIYLYETKISDLSPNVLSQSAFDDCSRRLRDHFLDLATESSKLTETKVILLGNGRVGKTQIGRRLRDLDFDDSVPSTHGIEIHRYSIDIGDQTITVNLWDFGGQEIYHGTHAIFLSTQATFLIVWSPEFEQNDEVTHEGVRYHNHSLPYWLHYVSELAMNSSSSLLVQTRADHPEADVLIPPVKQALVCDAKVAKVLQVSTPDPMRGINELKAALEENISQTLGGVSHKIGLGRYNVIQKLRKWYAEDQAIAPPSKRKHRTLSLIEFKSLCQSVEGTITSTGSLLDYLHHSGLVFYRPDLFSERILLDQSWALEAIYSLFDREKTHRQLLAINGRFSQKR